MANQIPPNGSTSDEHSGLLATSSISPHQDVVECGAYGLGHTLHPGSLPWPYDPVYFPQQSQFDNTATIGTRSHYCCSPEASFGTLERSFPPVGPDPTQPVTTVQWAHPDLAPSLEISKPIGHAEAVVMELPDGRFYCSALGCLAIYLRAGDCRRHLKKHNGPFFPCTQPGCDMEFYRADKLRSHLKQGHNVVVAAPRRGRQTANRSTARPTGVNRPGGYQ